MLSRLRRLALGGLLVTVAIVAVVSAAVAGAATAPSLEPAPVIPAPALIPEDPPEAVHPPRGHVVRGAVVAIRDGRLALMVEAGERPIVVAVRPGTAVRLNTRKADFADLQRGDHAIVVGKAGPHGNMIARAIVAVRKPPPTPSA